MFKLILIELKKIFHKKSIFVMMIIILIFSLLNNILFYTDYDNDGNYKYLEKEDFKEEKEKLKNELKKYNFNNESDVSMYVSLKTKLDVIDIKEKFISNTWQYKKIEDYLYIALENVNVYTYQIKDETLLNDAKEKLEEYLNKLNENDWKYFINKDIEEKNSEINVLEKQLELVIEEKEKLKIKELVNVRKEELRILNYRLENNIKYDDSYLNNSLNMLLESGNRIKYYEDKKNLSYKEKYEYQLEKESFYTNKYILDNKQNYNKQNNLSYQLRTIVDDYEIFVIIIILIIASTIVAEEFRDGTIKLLLIKPYSRGKILLSKYFAVIITLLIVILYLILLQLIIGGFIFGFSSLKIPVIVYNFSIDCVLEYDIFIYMLIRILTKLPMLIMLVSISFCLSTVINNVSTSITIPLFIYIFTSSINYFIVEYKINIFKYFINVNWEFNNYLFGKISEMDGLGFRISLIIWCIYFIIIMVFTYFNFKKKNIRNL